MRRERWKFLATLAFLSAPYVVMASWLAGHLGWQSCAIYVSVALGGVLLLAMLVTRARYFLLLHLPVFVLAGVIAAYTIVCDQLPGFPIAMVLETSSWEEVRGFLGVWEGEKLVLLFVGAIACYLALSFAIASSASLRDHARLIRRAFLGCLVFVTTFAAAAPARLFESFSASPVIGTAMFLSGPLSSADYSLHAPMERKRPYGAARAARDEVHILLIGESARRDSWSVYGYSRPTTPYLASIKDEIVLFSNALTDGNATIFAVPIMLTGINPESFTLASSTGNLVDLVKEAGYLSGWLENQDPGPAFLVGVRADMSNNTYVPKGESYVVFPPDEVLLPELERQLAHRDKALFIGMHLYGSHSPYQDRYPASFARFEAKAGGATLHKLLDSYDDSILYTDWFLSRVIERVRKLEVPATVTYLSDHGEDLQELDGRSGHGAGDYSAHAFEIPAFVWANEAYRRAHPDKVAALVANTNKVVRTHDFFFSLADLMGIRWPGFLPQRSFASLTFVPDTTDRFIAGGKLVTDRPRSSP
jgi:glucan phosphoethanolaminetransferase (alkaline phosphatase superfamily)